MATFSTVIRKQRSNGFYPVYICINHKCQPGYIKTSYTVSEKGLRKTYTQSGKEKLEIADPKILQACFNQIGIYNDQLENPI